MIIVDSALEKRESDGNPIRVGLIGAGYVGRGVALEILTSIVGMRLVAISNRTLGKAKSAYEQAGLTSVRVVDSSSQLDDAIARGEHSITDNPMLLCESETIDAIIEATGNVDFGARVVTRAIQSGKHVILANAELGATLGPILKTEADRAGVVFTDTDGDEPGVAMGLYRLAKTIGYKPVLAGNIKGFIDPYRTPQTQQSFATKVNQNPTMITSFADGTKLSLETTLLANATGLKVGKRGMFGHRCTHVKEILDRFSADQLLECGLVDYVLGAEPGSGAFVVGYNSNPILKEYMNYFKMGNGPLYLFYTPFHLPHLQLALTVARAVLFHDATVAPRGAPVCDVISIAKKDLSAGDVLDGIGGFTCYGTIENSTVCHAENLLPIGLSQGCLVVHNLKRDQPITYADVVLPSGRLCDELRATQSAYFGSEGKFPR